MSEFQLMKTKSYSKIFLFLLVIFSFNSSMRAWATNIYITSTKNHDYYKILPVSLKEVEKGPSGKKVPRFMATKSNQINGRLGPSIEHPVIYKFKNKNEPLLIVQETHTGWLRVVNSDGYICWIKSNLLTNNNYLKLQPSDEIALYKHANEENKYKIDVSPTEIEIKIYEKKNCLDNFCKVLFTKNNKKIEGYVKKQYFWGFDENFNEIVSQLKSIDEITFHLYE